MKTKKEQVQNNFCTIYFARHGQTDWNKEDKIQGHTDIHLNKQGEEQALHLQKQLTHVDFNAAFSSDLHRAYKTAELALGSKNIPILKTSALRERCLRSWEGKTKNDLAQMFKGKHAAFDLLSHNEFMTYKIDEQSESYKEVYSRVKNYVTQYSKKNLGSSLFVATHGGVLRSLLYGLDFRQGQRWQVSNCAYLKINVDAEGNFTLVDTEGITAIKTREAFIPF